MIHHIQLLSLYDIVKQGGKYKSYELDELALEMEHEVVYLPSYHCQYNPIELIWTQIKGKVTKKNSTVKIKEVRKLLEDAIKHNSKSGRNLFVMQSIYKTTF